MSAALPFRHSLRRLAAGGDEPDRAGPVHLLLSGLRRRSLPEAVGQIAIDGKTSRGSHDRGRGQAALHFVSAYTHCLVLGQLAVADKSNEITAFSLLLKELAASGAASGSLVSIDAMGCQSDIAETIVDLGGDYLLATKDNQKTALAEIQFYFDDTPADEIDTLTEVEKAMAASRRAAISSPSASTG